MTKKQYSTPKSERWDGEKVHRSNSLAMVAEERQPSLHWVRISRGSADPSRDTPFREIETQLEQLAMNARRSPSWILSHHTEDQGANLFADTLPSSYLADSGDPRPIQTKPRAMPVHDGSRSDQDERLGPPGPERSQRNPEQFVRGSQSTARLLCVQSQQLPTESEVLEDEVLPGMESADQPAEEMSERHDCGKNLAEKSECSFSPSHSFCRCTTFWRHNPQISPGFRGSRSIPELHGLPVPGLWIRRLRGMETSAAPAGRPPALGQ